MTAAWAAGVGPAAVPTWATGFTFGGACTTSTAAGWVRGDTVAGATFGGAEAPEVATAAGAAPTKPRRASDAAPAIEGVPLPWMPLRTPLLLPSDGDWVPARWRELAVEMMASPLDDVGTAVVVGRSGGPAFRRSELLRFAHLTGIAATVARLPPT